MAGYLSALPALHRELGEALANPVGSSERISGGGGPGLPLDDRVVCVRAAITTTLARWAGTLAGRNRTAIPDRTVPALAGYLVRHIGRLAAHPAAGSAVDEFAALVRSGRRALSGDHTRRVPVGACVHPGCVGTMTATVGNPRPLIQCGAAAEHCWRPDQWHALRRVWRAGAGLTAADITAIWGIAPGTVYWLANANGWRRHRDGRRVFYHLDDVTDTINRQVPGSPPADGSGPRRTSPRTAADRVSPAR